MNQVNSSYMTTKELVGNASRVADKLTAEAEQLQRYKSRDFMCQTRKTSWLNN